ncbi:DUF5819 family protein [Aeromicrobium sp. CF3.5]|uniref:DUF5819 family protein n=1 Tax=Aeromicrobium sp. CF3.5 TaxID=3373078 RepID=UPI003EE60D22
MPEPVSVAGHLGRWQRLVVLVLGVVLVAHTVLLALWLAPSSPIRDTVGAGNLATYVDPYFQQGNDVVGVGSNQVDESLVLRARVQPEGGGEPFVTEWIDVTATELRAVRGELGPSRSHQMARRVATNMNFAVFGLDTAQRETIAETEANVPVVRLQRALNEQGSSAGAVQNFMAQDQMATQLSSLWLGALYDDVELLEVQYRVGRRVVPDIADRVTQKITDTDFDYFDIGWRAAYRANPEARAAFNDYLHGDAL